MEMDEPKSSSFCVNCRSRFKDGFEPVSQISVSFHNGSDGEEEDDEGTENISIVEALSTVFVSKELVKRDGGISLSMCFRCAQTLSELYRAYIQLLYFSDATAHICRLIRQINCWHQKQGLPRIPDPHKVKEEVEERDGIESDNGSFTHYHYGDADRVLSVEMESQNQSPVAESDSVTLKEELSDMPENREGVRRSLRITVTRNIRSSASKDVLPELRVKNKSKNKKKSAASKTKPCLSTATAPSNKTRRTPLSDSSSDSEDSEEDEQKHNSSSDMDTNTRGYIKRRKKMIKTAMDCGWGKKRFHCTQSGCKRKYASNWRMEQHILSDHQKKKSIQCQLCYFKCLEPEAMTNHVCVTKEERESQDRLFRCDRCGKPCHSLGASRHHVTWHDYKDKEVLKCPVQGCKLEWRSQQRLQIHLTKVHEGGSEPAKKPEKVQCQICGNFYVNVKVHMLTHTMVKKFLCTECGKRFSRAGPFQEHMRSHSSVRNYQCQLCRVCFKRPNHLSRHYRSSAHADADPDQIAELAKHVVKHKTDGGPVIIPPRYKFKDHHLWARKREGRASRTVSSQKNSRTEVPDQSDGSGHDHDQVPELSAPANADQDENPSTQLPFSSIGTFPPQYSMLFARHHPPMFGDPDFY